MNLYWAVNWQDPGEIPILKKCLVIRFQSWSKQQVLPSKFKTILHQEIGLSSISKQAMILNCMFDNVSKDRSNNRDCGIQITWGWRSLYSKDQTQRLGNPSSEIWPFEFGFNTSSVNDSDLWRSLYLIEKDVWDVQSQISLLFKTSYAVIKIWSRATIWQDQQDHD